MASLTHVQASLGRGPPSSPAWVTVRRCGSSENACKRVGACNHDSGDVKRAVLDARRLRSADVVALLRAGRRRPLHTLWQSCNEPLVDYQFHLGLIASCSYCVSLIRHYRSIAAPSRPWSTTIRSSTPRPRPHQRTCQSDRRARTAA